MVRYYVGDQQRLTFRYESGTYATASGANNWLGLVNTHTVDENMNVKPIRYAGTNSRLVQQFLDGAQNFTNSITYYPQNFRMLKFVLGSCVDGGSPSPYQHNYAPLHNNASAVEVANMPLPPFTIVDEKNSGVAGSNFVRTFNGCVANTWSLSVTQGEPVTCELGYVAQSLVYSSGAVVNVSGTDTTRPYMWRDVTLRVPSGTAFNEITNLTLSVNNNLDTPHYVDGNRTIGQPVPTNLDVELTATINATAEVAKPLYDQYFIGGSLVNVLLGVTQSAATEELLVTLSGCKLMDMTAPSSTEGVQTFDLTFSTGSVELSEFNDVQFHNFGSYAGF